MILALLLYAISLQLTINKEDNYNGQYWNAKCNLIGHISEKEEKMKTRNLIQKWNEEKKEKKYLRS